MENKEKDLMEKVETEATEAVEEVTEAAEATVEEAVEEVTEAAEATVEEAAEVAEAVEEATEATEATVEDATEIETPQMKASTAAKREKKEARRNAKAERKAANKIEEKKSRPNNLLLAIMIFGVLILMFVCVKGYNYFSLEPSIEKYLENNGGEEQFGSMAIDQYTTAAITAEKNSLKIVMDTKVDEDQADSLKEYYSGDDWEDNMEYIGSYFLTSFKPLTRGLSGDVTVVSNFNGEEVKSLKLTLKEAKEVMEPDEDEDQADAETADGEDADDAEDDADDDAEDVEDEESDD